MPSKLSVESRKILSRWAKDKFYVYLRPVTSKFIDAASPHTIYWNVSVEFRTVPPGRWEAEGYDLDACIKQLGEQVPRRRAREGEKLPSGAGGYAPKSMREAEVREAKKALKKTTERIKELQKESERPRRKKDRKKKRAQ